MGVTVTARPELALLPAYVPGRTVPGAVKLASNETSYPLLPAVAARIGDVAADANRYPDLASVELRDALAARFDSTRDQVAVGCGSVALCQQIVQAFAGPGSEVLFGWRSFEAYPILATIAGAAGIRAAINADQSLDLDAMAGAVTDRTKVIFVCTPNNPTGTAVRGAELVRFLDAVPSSTLVVLDEAYREFVTDPDVPDGTTLLDRGNVVVLRTFSKAYGLAGLRVGYGIAADPDVAEAIRKVAVPFSVSAVAQHAAMACLQPDTEKQLLTRVDEVVSERARVTQVLRAGGYVVPSSQANFVWLPLAERTTDFSEHCERNGIIVRAFAGDGTRVTIGTPEENDLFLDAAASFVRTG